VTGVTPFSRRLHAGLRVITIGLPLVVAGMLVTLLYVAASYGNPRPDNWFRLELLSRIISDSLLPLCGIWVLAVVGRIFAARGHRWPLVVPVLLLPVAVQAFGGYMKGMQHVRDCEAVIIMCFDSDGQAGLA
jgi:hypothetical protein